MINRLKELIDSSLSINETLINKLNYLVEAKVDSSDIAASKDEYEKVLKYFNGKIDFLKLDEAWKKLFNVNFFDITGSTPDFVNKRRQRHISKYSSTEEKKNIPLLVKLILKNYPDGLQIYDDVYGDAVAAFTEGVNRLYCSPSVWRERKDGDGNIKIGPSFLAWDDISNVSTGGFLAKKVKAAIYDSLRKLDIVSSPKIRAKIKELSNHIKKYEQENNGYKPSEAELAKLTNMPVDEIKKLLNAASLRSGTYDSDLDLLSGMDTTGKLDTGFLGKNDPGIIALTEDELFRASKVIQKNLSGNTRFIVELYIFEGIELKEMDDIFPLSQKDINELFTDGIERIKFELKNIDWEDIL